MSVRPIHRNLFFELLLLAHSIRPLPSRFCGIQELHHSDLRDYFAGNFNRDEAAEFLQSYADVLKPDDTIIVGLDSCGNPDMV